MCTQSLSSLKAFWHCIVLTAMNMCLFKYDMDNHMTPRFNTLCAKFHTRILCKQSSQCGRTVEDSEDEKGVKKAIGQLMVSLASSAISIQLSLLHASCRVLQHYGNVALVPAVPSPAVPSLQQLQHFQLTSRC